MAGDGIEFKFTSNERDLLRGAGDAESALEDVADALDDVTKAGDSADQLSFADTVREAKRLEDAGEDAGKAIDRSMGKAADETDQLERRFKDAERRAKDLGDAGERAGRDVDRGMERASDGVDELRDEANSTAREAAASFDGSAESIADAFQEIAANAFAGFGPAGAVAGLAAAAGIGMVVAGFDAANEAAEESRQRASEWAQAYIEAGGAVLNAQQRVAMLQEIASDPDRWREAQDNAKEWGVELSTAMRAMIGDADALAAANESLTAREQEARDAMLQLADGGEMLSEVLQGQTAETRNGREALTRLQEEMANGNVAADAYADSLLELARTSDDATMRVDELGNTIYELPGGVVVGVDADTQRATTNIESLAEDVRTLPDGSVDVTANVSRADASLNAWLRRQRSMNVTVNTIARNGQRLAV